MIYTNFGLHGFIVISTIIIIIRSNSSNIGNTRIQICSCYIFIITIRIFFTKGKNSWKFKAILSSSVHIVRSLVRRGIYIGGATFENRKRQRHADDLILQRCYNVLLCFTNRNSHLYAIYMKIIIMKEQQFSKIHNPQNNPPKKGGGK